MIKKQGQCKKTSPTNNFFCKNSFSIQKAVKQRSDQALTSFENAGLTEEVSQTLQKNLW